MKTKNNSEQKSIRDIAKMKRAEKLAWFFFFGIGVSYIVLTLILQIA